MCAESIYFDNHATTSTVPEALKEMRNIAEHDYGNPHSDDHSFGWSASKKTEIARRQISDMLRCEPDEIIFTSGATEANNLALLGFARGLDSPTQTPNVIVSAVEHKCTLGAAKALTLEGWELKIAPVLPDGLVDLHKLSLLIDENTKIVSVMAVNNEIGTIQPIEKIAAICKQKAVEFHSDGAQAPLAIDTNVTDLDIGLMSLSSHKIHGPSGVGALYVRRDLQRNIKPLMHGGGQESGIRPGTLPTTLCVGFGVAAAIASSEKRHQQRKEIEKNRDLLLRLLKNTHADCGTNGSMTSRHPGNLNIRYKDIDASRLIGKLQPHLAISSGSACTTGIPETSHVLRAIGLDSEQAESSIRIGISRFTSESEIRKAADLINNAVTECYESDSALASM